MNVPKLHRDVKNEQRTYLSFDGDSSLKGGHVGLQVTHLNHCLLCYLFVTFLFSFLSFQFDKHLLVTGAL